MKSDNGHWIIHQNKSWVLTKDYPMADLCNFLSFLWDNTILTFSRTASDWAFNPGAGGSAVINGPPFHSDERN